MAFTPSLDRFRFYNDDGSASASTAAADQNVNVTTATGSGNVKYQLRLGVQETGGTSGANTDDWQLQYSKNGGAYADVTTTSSNVKAFDSTHLTDAASIAPGAHRLTGGTGSAVGGKISEDGLLDDLRLTASNRTEFLYTIELIATELVNSDTLDFRVLHNGVAITSTATPRATVSAAIVLEPTPFTNTQEFYSPTLTYGQTLSPSLFTNSQVFYEPIISPITLNPSLFTNTQTFYAPTVSQGLITLLPSLFTNTQTFYAASLGDSREAARTTRMRRGRARERDYITVGEWVRER